MHSKPVWRFHTGFFDAFITFSYTFIYNVLKSLYLCCRKKKKN